MGTLRDVFESEVEAATLFIIRKDLAIGWKGFVKGNESPAIDSLGIPLNEPGVLNQPYHFGEAYFGLAEKRSGDLDNTFWAHLGCAPPKEIAVYPIELFGQICCLLYVHGPGPFEQGVCDGVTELAECLTTSFRRLVRAAER